MLYIIDNKKLVNKYGTSAKKNVSKNFEQTLITKELLKFINSVVS